MSKETEKSVPPFRALSPERQAAIAKAGGRIANPRLTRPEEAPEAPRRARRDRKEDTPLEGLHPKDYPPPRSIEEFSTPPKQEVRSIGEKHLSPE